MELKPHFRVVRFTPVPEIQEGVNVALLFVDERARLVMDSEFQKLGCVAPNFDKSILQFWLSDIGESLSSIKPQDAYAHIASRTAQIQVGATHFITRKVTPEFESHLVDTYLRKAHRPSRHGENHIQYVDTLIDDAIKNPNVDFAGILKRAEPSDFLSQASLELLKTRNIRFSRVMNGTKKIILMDGLNLGVSSKSQLRLRSSTIGTGFFTLGNERAKIEQIEQKEITRAAFLFRRPQTDDPEISYIANVLSRDSDLIVETEAGKNIIEIHRLLQNSSGNLI